MVVGFTGRRDGMSKAQEDTVVRRLVDLCDDETLTSVHGDCVGADEAFDTLCAMLGIPRGIRPCTFESMRAHCERRGAAVLAEPLPPMRRNRAIVADADILIACPPNTERLKKGSGTWATIGFGEKKGIPVVVVFPNGSVRS
jgi:hypothetical protein